MNEIRRHVVVAATATHGENEQGVARREARGSEPCLEARVPALVVRARGELCDVVGRSVGLEVAQLPKVVHCMRRVGCAASDPEDEQASAACSHGGHRACDFLELSGIEGFREIGHLAQIHGRVRIGRAGHDVTRPPARRLRTR